MKISIRDLNERVTFNEDISKSINGLPQRPKRRELYSCYACIQDAKESDTQTSINNNSKFIKTIIIRDPRGDYKPSNKHYIIHDGVSYDVKYYKPDYRDKSFLRIYCEVVI